MLGCGAISINNLRPIPGKSEAEMQSATPTLDKLLADGALNKAFEEKVAKGKTKASKGRE